MKKYFIIVAMVIFGITAHGQQAGKPLSYTNVVKVDSTISPAILYQTCRTWFARKYNSSKDVIQYEDKENGKIIGKGRFEYVSDFLVYSNATKGYITYTITVGFKDGRYKYELTDFVHQGNPDNIVGAVSFGLITDDIECPYQISTKGWRNKVWKELKTKIDKNAQHIITSLITDMNAGVVKDSDKW